MKITLQITICPNSARCPDSRDVWLWPACSRSKSCQANSDSCRSCSAEFHWTSHLRHQSYPRGVRRPPSCSVQSRWTRHRGYWTASCRTRRHICLTTVAPTTPTSRSISATWDADYCDRWSRGFCLSVMWAGRAKRLNGSMSFLGWRRRPKKHLY